MLSDSFEQVSQGIVPRVLLVVSGFSGVCIVLLSLRYVSCVFKINIYRLEKQHWSMKSTNLW
jgi:hypothetical protein